MPNIKLTGYVDRAPGEGFVFVTKDRTYRIRDPHIDEPELAGFQREMYQRIGIPFTVEGLIYKGTTFSPQIWNPKGPRSGIDIQGRVERRKFAEGSKSEHEAYCLVAKGHIYRIRLEGQHPYLKPNTLLEPLVGLTVTMTGTKLAGHHFLVKSWRYELTRRSTGRKTTIDRDKTGLLRIRQGKTTTKAHAIEIDGPCTITAEPFRIETECRVRINPRSQWLLPVPAVSQAQGSS